MRYSAREIATKFHHFLKPIFDPVRAMRGLPRYLAFWGDYRRYAALPGSEPLRLRDARPCIHDRTSTTDVDYHYFYCNGWAMRRIVAQRPECHIDIGSQTMFVNLLSSVVPVIFIDYRPLQARIDGLSCIGADILKLPFADKSVQSLSCLHVAEHIGLGRYGDPLNPYGARQACAELSRVLAPGGNLFFALPIGQPRVCFNAHRIFGQHTILSYFSELELVEFTAVDDFARYLQDIDIDELTDADYACGMFWFRRTL